MLGPLGSYREIPGSKLLVDSSRSCLRTLARAGSVPDDLIQAVKLVFGMEVDLHTPTLSFSAALPMDPDNGAQHLLHPALSLAGIRVNSWARRLCRRRFDCLNAALYIANAQTFRKDELRNFELGLAAREREQGTGMTRREL